LKPKIFLEKKSAKFSGIRMKRVATKWKRQVKVGRMEAAGIKAKLKSRATGGGEATVNAASASGSGSTESGASGKVAAEMPKMSVENAKASVSSNGNGNIGNPAGTGNLPANGSSVTNVNNVNSNTGDKAPTSTTNINNSGGLRRVVFVVDPPSNTDKNTTDRNADGSGNLVDRFDSNSDGNRRVAGESDPASTKRTVFGQLREAARQQFSKLKVARSGGASHDNTSEGFADGSTSYGEINDSRNSNSRSPRAVAVTISSEESLETRFSDEILRKLRELSRDDLLDILDSQEPHLKAESLENLILDDSISSKMLQEALDKRLISDWRNSVASEEDTRLARKWGEHERGESRSTLNF
jgi:hypothetical protein